MFIHVLLSAKEAEHVDGFAKECAVVTHHRLCVSPDGTDLIPDPEAELEVRELIGCAIDVDEIVAEVLFFHLLNRGCYYNRSH